MRNYYLSLCLFLLSFPLYVEAQSPGGVNGAESDIQRARKLHSKHANPHLSER